MKPEFYTNPNHCVLTVEGTAVGEPKMNDMAVMWYVSTLDEYQATFSTDHV